MKAAHKPTLRGISAELREIYKRNYANVKAARQIPTNNVKASTGNNDGPSAMDAEVLGHLEDMMNTPGFIQYDVARVGRLIKTLKGAMGKDDREDTVKELRKAYRRNVAAITRAQEAKGGRGKSSAGSDSILKAPPRKERSISRGQ